jgi:hypothetical protein
MSAKPGLQTQRLRQAFNRTPSTTSIFDFSNRLFLQLSATTAAALRLDSADSNSELKECRSWGVANARYCDLPELLRLSKLADFQQAHRQWIEIALWDEFSVRDARWSEAVAVCSLALVEKVKSSRMSLWKKSMTPEVL